MTVSQYLTLFLGHLSVHKAVPVVGLRSRLVCAGAGAWASLIKGLGSALPCVTQLIVTFYQ